MSKIKKQILFVDDQPEIDGAALLEYMQRDYLQMARIFLSGLVISAMQMRNAVSGFKAAVQMQDNQALSLVTCQRLVRRLCSCSLPAEPLATDHEFLDRVSQLQGDLPTANTTLRPVVRTAMTATSDAWVYLKP